MDRIENDVSELEVFMAFYGYICRHLKAMTMAFVESIKGDAVTVKPFPIGENETEKVLTAYCLSSSDKALIEGGAKLCLVGFTDRKFADNLRSYLSTGKADVYSDNSDLHSEMNGIIIRVFD